jgi:hypothetical protein
VPFEVEFDVVLFLPSSPSPAVSFATVLFVLVELSVVVLEVVVVLVDVVVFLELSMVVVVFFTSVEFEEVVLV